MDVYIHDTYFRFTPTWHSLASAPLMAMLLVGLAICVWQRNARPRRARFAGAAILLLMVQLSPLMEMVRAFLVQGVGQPRRYGDPPSPSEFEAAFFTIALVDVTLGCVEIGLVLWALFGPEGGKRGRYLLEGASQTEPPCTGNNST
jgi:hypothetical protein